MPSSQNRSSFILGRAIASPLPTQGGSRMRESRLYGSVRGARDETRVPTATSTSEPLSPPPLAMADGSANLTTCWNPSLPHDDFGRAFKGDVIAQNGHFSSRVSADALVRRRC